MDRHSVTGDQPVAPTQPSTLNLQPSTELQPSTPRPPAVPPRFGAQLARTSFLLQRRFAEWVGCSGAEYRLLELAAEQDGISQSEIERRIAADGAIVTRVAKQLELEGLVERRPDPRDNRFTRVTITSAGRERLDSVRAKLPDLEATVYAGISLDDLATAQRVVERMRENLLGKAEG